MSSPTSGEKIQSLSYTNWSEWSEFWKDHLGLLDLWQYVDPDLTSEPPATTQGREAAKLLRENFVKLRQNVSYECRKLIGGHTTPRSIWAALKAGCDRGTILPLLTRYEAFHNEKWEANDTIATFTSRLRNNFLALEHTEYKLNDNIAVYLMVSRLPDAYNVYGQSIKQLKLPFIEAAAYLLANIKDTITAGNNTSGQALVTQNHAYSRR
jgi:hypothetical protein